MVMILNAQQVTKTKTGIDFFFCALLILSTDEDCRTRFFSGHSAFAVVRNGAPLDFDCNLSARRCWGKKKKWRNFFFF